MTNDMMELDLNEMELVQGGDTFDDVLDHVGGAVAGYVLGGLSGMGAGAAIGGIVGGVPGACTGAQIGLLAGGVGGAIASGIIGAQKFAKGADNLMKKFLSLF